MTAVLLLAALVAGSAVLGLVWRARQGRVRRLEPRATGSATPAEAADLAAPGATVTLLQLSTEVCAPCAATRRVLERVADDRSGVTHVELDVGERTDVATRFRVLSTPTTLVLDAQGHVRARIAGAARPATVLAEIDRLIGASA